MTVTINGTSGVTAPNVLALQSVQTANFTAVTIPAYTNAGTASGSPSAAIITSRQITFSQTPSGSGEGNLTNVTYTASAEL